MAFAVSAVRWTGIPALHLSRCGKSPVIATTIFEDWACGSIVRIGTRNKQYYFSLNKDKKTRLIYLGDKRVDRTRRYSESYKTLMQIVEKTTILNMEILKTAKADNP